jgi:deoxycytidylate deaminase
MWIFWLLVMVCEKYFKVLQKVAEAVEPVSRSRQRLSACLVYKNEIIGMGFNKKKSHPFQRKFAKHEEAIYLHAEIDAIKNALKVVDADTISKSTLYIMRVKYEDTNAKKFVRGLSKPCEGCERAIAQFGIKKVYYTTEEGFDYL